MPLLNPFLSKTTVCCTLLTIAIGLAFAPDSSAGNPFVTSIFTADPSAHVWNDGRLYVYPSRDIDPAKGCDLMDKYHVFSTDDMVTWRDEGQILEASQVAWGRKEGGFMWAPDAAFKNGKYYFYFPHPSGTEWNKTWKVGVAVSDKPGSGFVPLPEPMQGLEGFAMIDPCVFIDTNGKAYIYFGGGGKCSGGRLKDNMTEIEGTMQSMEGLADFHEATWVFKRNGIYYLTYANNNPKENQLCYATSSSPLGPWESKGVYLDVTGNDTSHGSIVEYKGQWYAFYHNKAVSGKGNLRTICVDKLSFNPDGTIQTVVQTKEGVPSVGPAPAANPKAVSYGVKDAKLSGPATLAEDTAAPGGKRTDNFQLEGSTCEFTGVNGGKGGRTQLDIVYAAPANTKISLEVNGVSYSLLNAVATGGPNDYSGHIMFTLPLKAGPDNMIKITGGKGPVSIAGATLNPIEE